MSINRVELLGHLGANPQSKELHNGDLLAKFTIATNKFWYDDEGNRQQSTQWTRVACFRRQAELCMEHLEKGSQVFVEGELHTRSWKDDDGDTRYATNVRAHRVHFLSTSVASVDVDSSPPSPDYDLDFDY